jgi:hypothetical protein
MAPIEVIPLPTISTMSIVLLSGVVALNLVLHIHKKIDLIPPARDVGILKHHMKETWG